MQVKFKRLKKTAAIPVRAHDTDTGYDVFVPAEEEAHKTIQPGETYLCKLGFSIQFPNYIKVVNDLAFDNVNRQVEYGFMKIGLQVEVRSRSGLAKKGLVVANSPGTIDSGKEIEILLYNNSKKDIEIHPSDIIAKIYLTPYFLMDFEEEISIEQ